MRSMRERLTRHRDSDAGETLIELLITIVVITIVALAAGFALSGFLSQSQSVKNFAMFQPVLRNAAADLTSQLEYGTPSSYATCATAAQYQPGGSNAVNLSASIPNGYLVSVTSVAYWSGTQFVGTCPVPTSTPAPELITLTATNSASNTSMSTQVVIDNPYAPPTYPPDRLASHIAFVQQPTTSAANATISPSVAGAVENSNGAILIDDYSTMTISITPGTGATGAVLSPSCTGVENSGVFTFANCSIDTLASGYTLTATDGSLTAISQAFNIATVPGVPTAPIPSVTSPTSARVSWTAPSSDGDSPVTLYAVSS